MAAMVFPIRVRVLEGRGGYRETRFCGCAGLWLPGGFRGSPDGEGWVDMRSQGPTSSSCHLEGPVQGTEPLVRAVASSMALLPRCLV